ncbi:metabolite MFS transporter, MHS family [Laribacter hongkongensis HLHK9]|uniref:Metabolite MFS transporter, MHS family n=2 Tax=Laribacter hongkongensis TaxID=168471 RepID=C1D9K8_LARHH|nr:metabolite MFS transporter, MHS family [Laribacter hongkongensis HLHK9]
MSSNSDITSNSGHTINRNDVDEKLALRRAAVASFIGNFVEWFDYASYGYLAAVIAVVFFPEADKTAGLLAAFAVFAISFLIRPVGGIFWGHIGDRIGRRNALSWSILIMSGATFCIAFLPSYASIGMWAPILLLVIRMVQGFSASGEYAGASAFLAEYAPTGKRGLYCSIVPASTAAGLLFGSLFVAGMHMFLTLEQIHDWGWRVPFLLAAPFGLIGRYIRVHLQDTPKFRQMEEALEKREVENKVPIHDLLGKYRAKVIIAFGVTCLNAVAFYTILSYMPTYLSAELGMTEQSSFIASTISLVTYIGFIFLMGELSDRFGRKTMLVSASILFMLLGRSAVQHARPRCLHHHPSDPDRLRRPAVNERRHAGQLPVGNLPDQGALQRLCLQLQLGQCPVWRHGSVHRHLADQRHGQQAGSGLVSGHCIGGRTGRHAGQPRNRTRGSGRRLTLRHPRTPRAA